MSLEMRAPTIASAMVNIYPNCSYVSEGSDSDDDYTPFEFTISNEVLLDPNDVVTEEMIEEKTYFFVYKGLFKNELPVAVKIIQPNRYGIVSKEYKEKFQKEVLLLSKLKVHDNIQRFIGACIEPQMMIVSELLEGGTLETFLSNSQPNILDLKNSLGFAFDISRAMEHLHSNGIIYRDLKPSNILLTSNFRHVKLTDFGNARDEIKGGMTNETGTYRYMAPEAFSIEQLRHGERLQYDHKIDVYSFGLVFWRILTNKIPFHGIAYGASIAYLASQNERPSLRNVPEGAAYLMEACWSQDPNARPEFKEITVLLLDLLMLRFPYDVITNDARRALNDEDTRSIDTTTSSMQVNYVNVVEGSRSGIPIEDSNNNHVMKPENEKKKMKKIVKKIILPFFKKFRACLYKP